MKTTEKQTEDGCSHNNFVPTRRTDKFQHGFCADCKKALKKQLNAKGKGVGEFLPD
jgi:hypothetical protein